MLAMAGPLPNRKHEIFAVELATGAPLLSAYLTAGYQPGYSARFNASRLRNKPHIRERIEELFRESARHAVVGIAWIQTQLAAIAEGKAPAKIRTDSDGKRTEEVDRLGALTALARSVGAFRDPVDEILAKGLAGLTDAEIHILEQRLSKTTVTISAPPDNAGLGDRLDRAVERASVTIDASPVTSENRKSEPQPRAENSASYAEKSAPYGANAPPRAPGEPHTEPYNMVPPQGAAGFPRASQAPNVLAQSQQNQLLDRSPADVDTTSAEPDQRSLPLEPVVRPSSPARPGRMLFLQLARARASGPRPLSPEFHRLDGGTQEALVRFVSPTIGDANITWPTSPQEIVAIFERMAPCELEQLINLMAEYGGSYVDEAGIARRAF